MYLNLIQIAESFGVAESVVEDWMRKEGLPHMVDRGRPLFDRAQVADWAAARGLAGQAGFLAPETRSPFAAGWLVERLLRTGGIWRDLAAADVPMTIDRVVSGLPGATPSVRKMLQQRLRAEGGITIAPVGGGFGLPHPSARIALGRDAGTVALLMLKEAWPGAQPPDGVPVTRMFFFIAPSPRAHLDLLGQLSRLLKRGSFRELVLAGAGDEDIFLAVAAGDGGEPAGRDGEGRP